MFTLTPQYITHQNGHLDSAWPHCQCSFLIITSILQNQHNRFYCNMIAHTASDECYNLDYIFSVHMA